MKRKHLSIPEDTFKELNEYLQKHEEVTGLKISYTSFVSRAILEKIERDSKKE